MMRSLFALALLLGTSLVTLPAVSAEEGHAPAAAPAEHGSAEGHGAKGHAAEGHGAGHHLPHFSDINWFYGVLGERDGVEPSILYRPTGMPAPFGAYLLNAAILYLVLYRFAKKPVAEGLKSRKASILRGMDEAARMRKDAEARLADYEAKLENIDQEIERVRREMREDGQSERTRILAEARVRRERMEREAHLLVEQEFAAVRETLSKELVTAAFRSATVALTSRVTSEDQQRLADEYLAGVQKAGSSLGGGA